MNFNGISKTIKKIIPTLQLPCSVLKFQKNNSFSTLKDDGQEIVLFKTLVSQWWDPMGPLKPLHSMNKLRIPLIRDGLINTGLASPNHIKTSKPLKGLKLLDVGCGGGILSEPLARLGATVTGLDANDLAIQEARKHASESSLDISYLADPLEKHLTTHSNHYDGVIASEVIEHVTDKSSFVNLLAKGVKSGGSLFITTLNRTFLCELLCIYVAENILNLMPKGTHDINKFIKPHELQSLLEKNGCKVEILHGMHYNFITNRWSWSTDNTMSYAMQATKGRL